MKTLTCRGVRAYDPTKSPGTAFHGKELKMLRQFFSLRCSNLISYSNHASRKYVVHDRFSRFSRSMFAPLVHVRELACTNVLHGKAVDTATLTAKKKQKQKAMPPRPMWLIIEDDLEEKFIKGGGPGGQKINKSNIKVQITHKPTGIVVTSQDLRSQEKNRAKAREILALKLEQLQNPETCRLNVLADKKRATKRNRAKKSARKRRQQEEESKSGDQVSEIELGPEEDISRDQLLTPIN